ncbi:hypothetical protein BaRGS_00033268 [Batillaria attramentaria]|uniref:Uncharacterized protein n=1 Tax=Batillaria attramentaria TaxID=370345 RepID=A0ABD0JKQ7_9CAEN
MRRSHKTRVVVFNAPSAAMWGRPAMNGRRRLQMALCGLTLFTVIAFVMAVYVFNKVSHRESFLPTWKIEYHSHFRPPAFQSNDGLEVTWYSDLNSQDSLMKVLSAPCKNPEVSIFFQYASSNTFFWVRYLSG